MTNKKSAIGCPIALFLFSAQNRSQTIATAVALATDMNPGSAPCFSLPLTMAIGCRYLRVLPSEALNASTINAAHALGLANRVGSLEVGKSGLSHP